jgi:hypothetical protein
MNNLDIMFAFIVVSLMKAKIMYKQSKKKKNKVFPIFWVLI